MGRPTKYKPQYCQEIIDFFNVEPFEVIKGKIVPIRPRFLSQFAHLVGVAHDTLIDWTKRHDEFSESYKKAKEMQKNLILTNAIMGLYNPAMSIFTLKNISDMRDTPKETSDEDLKDTELDFGFVPKKNGTRFTQFIQ